MESELNRARMVEALNGWKDEFHRSKERLTGFGSFASLASKVATVVPAISGFFSRRRAAGGKPKLPLLLNSMMTGTSLWLLLRSFRRKT